MQDLDTGQKICTFLEKKVVLFNQYVSLTKRMKDAPGNGGINNLGRLISKRQDLMRKIEKIDLSIKRVSQTAPDQRYRIPKKVKGLIDSYLKTIKNIMETVEPLDRELMAVVKQKCEIVQGDLLKMQKVRQAAKGYGSGLRHPARFLDTRR